jgi:hypothetical protein
LGFTTRTPVVLARRSSHLLKLTAVRTATPCETAAASSLTFTSYRHPFLVNATAASPLRSYMDEYAQSLKAEFVNSSGPLQHTAQDPVVPTFVFDAEQAHIVQRPDKHNCIYMLWFLTQARVPGASPTSTDENDFIWNRFKVPGSEGWRPGGRGIMVRGSESVQPNPEHGVYWGG